MNWDIFWYQICGQSLVSPSELNTASMHAVSWKRKYLLTNNSIIRDPPQDFDAQGESTLTTRFSALDTIKREEFEQRNVLKFLNNSLRAK